jgi:predicted amidohydrolase
MNTKLISIYQYNINPNDLDLNLQRIMESARLAAIEKSSLLILPELCLHGYNYARINGWKNWMLPAVTDVIGEIAKSNSIAIAGSFVENDQGKLYNTFVMVNSEGMIVHTYRKIHLFNLLGEGDFFSAGNEIRPFNSELGITGSAICYDLRFPEFIRKLALNNCGVMIIPAEWPKPRIEHWKILLQARAIENQVFMIGVNCVGSVLGVDYGGNSAVVNPWGEVIASLDENEGLITVPIDLDLVEDVRKRIPVWADRKPDIYL